MMPTKPTPQDNLALALVCWLVGLLVGAIAVVETRAVEVIKQPCPCATHKANGGRDCCVTCFCGE
jgi:hypothetical protein